MQAEINRLVQCGLLLTRFKPGGFDFYHLLLSRLEQVFVVQGECRWGNAVGEFLDADGFELVRNLARGAPQEYAGEVLVRAHTFLSAQVQTEVAHGSNRRSVFPLAS